MAEYELSEADKIHAKEMFQALVSAQLDLIDLVGRAEARPTIIGVLGGFVAHCLEEYGPEALEYVLKGIQDGMKEWPGANVANVTAELVRRGKP